MLGPNGHFDKECKQRELREVCHQNFWCGEERAHAINLSPGGMCYRMARRAEPGEIVTISHGPGLLVKARIAWTRRLDTCTEVGVQFLDTSERVEAWRRFLKTGTEAPKTDVNGEPILALPAPGQTWRPTFTGARIQLNNNSCAGQGSVQFGKSKSWTAAKHLMGPSQSGNSSQ
jgi:PilZ domain